MCHLCDTHIQNKLIIIIYIKRRNCASQQASDKSLLLPAPIYSTFNQTNQTYSIHTL